MTMKTAIVAATEFWKERISEILQEQFGVVADKERVDQEFDQALKGGMVEEFITAEGITAADVRSQRMIVNEQRRRTRKEREEGTQAQLRGQE